MNQQAPVDDDAGDVKSPWLPLTLAVVLAAVILALPLQSTGLSPEGQRLAAVTMVMAICWVAQPIPVAATSLIPIAAYPLLGILDSRGVSRAYADRNVFLFMGGFLLALAIERSGLHRRIALHIVSRAGQSPQRIVFGFMCATAVLSMWISNTASTMLMLPIALALLSTLREAVRPDEVERVDRLSVPLLLGIAYAASSGGLATLVGTPTNLSLRGFWERQASTLGLPELSAAEWMICFVPLSIVMLGAAGVIMTRPFRGLELSESLSRTFFRERLNALGRTTRVERIVFFVFLATATLWLLRKPLQFDEVVWCPAWPDVLAQLIGRTTGIDASHLPEMVDDSTIAIGMSLLLFVVPREAGGDLGQPRLLDWKSAQKTIPWGMLLLVGCGFAMADAFQQTALADWIGVRFAEFFAGSPLWLLILGVCLLMTFLTEFTTNVATVNTLLPTLAAMAASLQVDPRLLLIPATVSASCAFMLPIATPPNAIVFATGRIPMNSMIRYGFLLNGLGAILVTIVTLLLVAPVMRCRLD